MGIADNKSDMFTDPRFAALNVKYVRVMVPYDAMHDYALRTWLDGWMAGAKASGARPLVTFDRSRKRTSHNPSAAQMATSLKDVRKRYPFVKEFATWNEANINKRPETVARWWTAMRKACPTCTILGADLLDRGNVGTWARRFVKAAGRTPKAWGLHNYIDANLLRTTGTRKLLSAVKGAVWFTETGGVVSRNNGSGVKFPTGRPRGQGHPVRVLQAREAQPAGAARLHLPLEHGRRGQGRPPHLGLRAHRARRQGPAVADGAAGSAARQGRLTALARFPGASVPSPGLLLQIGHRDL